VNQLILRAEAIKLMGLKTITARHLALASQVISATLELLQSMRIRLGALLADDVKVRDGVVCASGPMVFGINAHDDTLGILYRLF
jgi:hypothetical protein